MKKRYQIGLVVIGCLIALIGLSYAYFVATNTGGGKGEEITVKTYTIDNVGFNVEGEIEFNDLDIYPGHKNIVKIKATAIGEEDIINYRLLWEGTNSLNTPLKYYVYKTKSSETAKITCQKQVEQIGARKYYYETCTSEGIENLGPVIKEGEITKSEEKREFVLAEDEVIKGTKEGNEVYYYVVLEYPNLNESQNIDMGGKLEGILTVKKKEDTIVDVKIKKMYQETTNGYEEITSQPKEGYVVNEEKSTCSNNAVAVAKGRKILITNLSTSNTECNIYFDKDKEKPVVNNIIEEVKEKEIKIKVEAVDNVGVTEYWYAINDNEFVKGEKDTYTYNNLNPNTNYEIKVYVKDSAGNQSETYTKTITTAPDTTAPIINKVTTSVTRTEINVVVDASDDIGVTEYYFQIDNNTPIRSTTNTYKFTGLAIGSTHTITVYVKDATGNQSTITTKEVSTEPDRVKPTITNITSSVTMTEINVTVIATDDVGVTEHWYSIDNGSFVKGTGNTYKFTGLGVNSTHTISVYVKDAAGNTSDVSAEIIVTAPDTVKPTISNVTTSVTKTEINITVSASDNVGVTEYWYQLDSNAVVKGTGNTHKFSGLAAGSSHTVKVYVKDAAGNQSDTTTKSITTDRPTGGDIVLGNITVNSGTPNFANAATTDEGVYKVEDGMYGGYSYYWRGAVTNNYVKFGGFCWRIIRINGDGSIRLIYDGATCHANGTKTAESIAIPNVNYNTRANQPNHVGWTYEGTNQRTLDGTSSNAKTQIESWYSSNLASYASKIADGKYCNDRELQSGSTWVISGRTFYYAGYKRLYTDYAPTLSCVSGDVYTLKVGLITADEVEFAGGKNATTNNTSYYLYNGQNYWTMSPYRWDASYAIVFSVGSYGALSWTYVVTSNSFNLRPVINLKADITFSGGNGTQTNPYVVQ